MPPGAPYNSFVLPYRIRVDEFATSAGQETIPALHLLSHTHSDHISGLQAKSFGHTVICSHDAKEMLLRHEVYAERSLHELEYRAEKTRTYSHLKVDPLVHPDGSMYYNGSRDLLRPLPLNTPTQIELSNDESVVITLFDANHCPGAVMFLIEGAKALSAYPNAVNSPEGESVTRTLEVIYLDTASVLSSVVVPTKDEATSGLIDLLKLFPATTYFFINSWTWGYEDILKAIARAFRCSIHLDRYKHSIYTHISDPLLRAIGTRDPAATRFHACERFDRCEFVAVADPHRPSTSPSRRGKRVVYVNPVAMDAAKWVGYIQDTKLRIARGELVTNLLVPLSRHSPLPELQTFVSLFRPHRIVPNTLIPALHGLDWKCIDRMFAQCLFKPVVADDSTTDIELPQDDALAEMDTSIINLVGGDGAVDLATKWAESGKLRRKIEVVKGWLGIQERRAVERVLQPAAPQARRLPSEWCLPSSSPSSASGDHNDGRGVPLTPVSSPLRFQLPRASVGQDQGKKRQRDSPSMSPRTPLSSSHRARLVLASPFSGRSPRRRRGSSPRASINPNPPSPSQAPLRQVGNTVLAAPHASSSKLPANSQAKSLKIRQLDEAALLRDGLRSPSGAHYRFFEILPAPAPTVSTPRLPQPTRTANTAPRGPREPPSRDDIDAERAMLAKRIKLGANLARAHPERVVSGAVATRERLAARHFRLTGQSEYLATKREMELRRVPSMETVYDAGEGPGGGGEEEEHSAGAALQRHIKEALAAGTRYVIPPLICVQSQTGSTQDSVAE
ncbi:hypothetical protein B0H10DRAFT_2061638 [Mycena sp. CBHHK59/15]|nr:hypothetical protein B0H10DRAFT_2061638 [Mycena sp. CBHHK59/15]